MQENFGTMQVKRRWLPYFVLSALIFLSVIISPLSAVFAADYDNHYAKATFDDWISRGLLIPDAKGNIYPESPVTKGEFCFYVNKIMGYSKTADISKFTDVANTHKYYSDVAKAMSAGYIIAESSTRFGVENFVSREFAVDIFTKIAKLKPDTSNAWLPNVKDNSLITSPFKNTMSVAIGNGFITGKPDYTVDPKRSILRSEVIVMLDRLNAGKRLYAFPGTYGPSTGNVQSNYSTIMSANVKLQNANVDKSLDINARTGESDVNLIKNNIKYKLYVNGGKNIYIDNCTIYGVDVNKKSAHLIYIQGKNNNVDTLTVNGDNSVIDINEGNKTKNIIINGKNVTVNVGKNVKIDNLTVNGANATINLADGSRLENVTLNAPTRIKGIGTIGKLTVTKGGSGSVIDPNPDEVDIEKNTSVKIDGKERGDLPKKILAGYFNANNQITLTTEDTLDREIDPTDYTVTIGGIATYNTSVLKTSVTEYVLYLPYEPAAKTVVVVTGREDLTGSVTLSPSSQPAILDGVANTINQITLTINNPNNKVFTKENLKLSIAGKETDSYTATYISPTILGLNITTALKNGQSATVTGQKGLNGTVTFGLVAAVKGIVFKNINEFYVNTDDTTGNIITDQCFTINIEGVRVPFTVKERSKTSYLITLTTPLAEGTEVYVEGKKFLSNSASDTYSSPYVVSKVTTVNKTTLTVTLASKPESTLTSKDIPGFQVAVDGRAIPVTNIVKVGTDKNNTTYNLTVNLDRLVGKLTVNNVATATNKGIVDYVAPVLVSVRMNDKPLYSVPYFRTEKNSATLIVEFSEPVVRTPPTGKFSNKDVALSGSTFNIVSSDANGIDVSGIKLTLTSNSVVMNLASAKLLNPGDYSITVDLSTIFDQYGNGCGTGKVTYKFNIIGSVPTVVSAKQNEQGHIDIKLSGATAPAYGNAMAISGIIRIMDGTTQIGTDIDYHYISYDEKTKAISINRDCYTKYALGKDTYKLVLTHGDYSILNVSKIKIDTVKPKIVKVSIKETPLIEESARTPEDIYAKTSKANAVLLIEFSEPVYDSPPSAKLTIKNLDTHSQALMVDADDTTNISLQNSKVSSSNKTVSISLTNAALLEPDMYILKLDTALIYDSVGNPVENVEGVSSILRYKFKVMRTPPKVTYTRQQASGDVIIRFTKYNAITDQYGIDMYEEGLITIYDPSLPEGEQQVGDIIATEYLTWDAVTKSLIIKRAGLTQNNMNKTNYRIELTHIDYDKLIINNVKIITKGPTTYTVTLANEGSPIALNNNAAANKVRLEGTVLKISFSSPAYKNTAHDKFTIEDFTKSILSPFSLVDDDDNRDLAFEYMLDLSKLSSADFKHSADARTITIDLRKAFNENLIQHNFTFSVNDTLIFDSEGVRVSNDIKPYRFKISMTPVGMVSAEQIEGSGDIVVHFATSEDPQQKELLNIYGRAVSEESDKISVVTIEQNGKFIGEIPLHPENPDDITFDFVAATLTIKKAALYKLIDDFLLPATLNGSQYTLVLTHHSYADSRVALKIDTEAPNIEKDYPKSTITMSGSTLTASVIYHMNEEFKINSIRVTSKQNNNIPYTFDKGTGNFIDDGVFDITFNIAPNTLPSDYVITIDAEDIFTNRKIYNSTLMHSAKLHDRQYYAMGTARIDGFGYNPEAMGPLDPLDSGMFLFEQGVDFPLYYNPETRQVLPESTGLIDTLAANTPTFDNTKPQGERVSVNISAEFTVNAPANAASVRYSDPIGTISIDEGTEIIFHNNTGKTVNLSNSVTFYASKPDGTDWADDEDMDSYTAQTRKSWLWRAAELEDKISYYILEYTMNDGSIIYTYVKNEVNKYEPPVEPPVDPTP